MAIYTLPDVKKFVRGVLKEKGSIKEISVTNAEFGEGFDTYVNIWYYDKWYNEEFEAFTCGEEEKEKKAIARGKRIADSLDLMCGKAKYNGMENC